MHRSCGDVFASRNSHILEFAFEIAGRCARERNGKDSIRINAIHLNESGDAAFHRKALPCPRSGHYPDSWCCGLRYLQMRSRQVCVPAHSKIVSPVNAMVGILVDDCGANFLFEELRQVVFPLQELHDFLQPTKHDDHTRQRLSANCDCWIGEA